MTREGILGLAKEGLAYATELTTRLRGLKGAAEEQLTRDATLGVFDEMTQALLNAVCFSQLMSMAHPDAEVREAAKACEPQIDAFQTALYMDRDIAEVFQRYAAKKEVLSSADARLLEFIVRDYRRNGLSLDAAGQEHLRRVNEELTQVGQAFEVHLAEATLSIEITKEQLDGLPPTYVATHLPDANGKIRITTDYPDYVPFMQYAHDRQAARELFILNLNRAADKNLPLLDRLLHLRKEKATLLGYPTWADYVLEPRMAKTSARVRSFLDELHHDLLKKRDEEMGLIRAMYVKKGGSSSEPIPASDSSYLEDQVAQETFALDSQKVSQYFEIGRVKQGILDISSRLYDLSFQKVDLPAWHADVEVFDVSSGDGEAIGRIYMDLHPRADKYKHAAVFSIRETKKLEDGSRLLPIASLVCNFPQPGATPALLSHDEVVTFFHEFGHALHHVLSDSPLASFAGTNVARDFVEAPSQMFEEWAWTRETLDLFATHYQTGETIPEDLFCAMQSARSFGQGIATQRQLLLADLDQTYHTREPGFDTTEVLRELHAKYSAFAFIPGTHLQATFGHLVGYDAGYYGYQWALSIAQDLFTRFKAEGMLNRQTALEYRKAILLPGGGEEEGVLIKRFLGREGNAEAYKRFLGV